MHSPNPSIFHTAASEILRPLESFVSVETTSTTLNMVIERAGLRCHGKPLESWSLPLKYQSLRTLAAWVQGLLDENAQSGKLHGKPQWLSTNTYTTEDFKADHAVLAELYAENFISPEKKDLIADLETSQGHYIKSEKNPALHIFDAASQIASLNMGFNSGKRHPLLMRPEAESHQLLPHSDLKIALSNFLERRSGLPYVTLWNSGSEANDFCLSRYKLKYPRRAKAFAFEGSFHGRTLLALHTTHSPAKREPFEIYKGLVDFFTWPEDKTPHTEKREPSDWLDYWANAKESHQNPIFMGWLKMKDPLLVTEACVLDRLRKEFKAGNLPFALIIEPMQCEGGDRYATARFMRALRVLTRAFDVPLIYDEVQTGFGLGGPFFWHELFKLQKIDGTLDHPDAITLAKKSQVGACLSNEDWATTDGSSPAGWHRGYLQAQSAMDGPEVDDLASLTLKCLEAFAHDTVPEWVGNPRGQAFAFAFDLPEPEIANELIKVRFDNGILIYPAGDRTLRFRLMVTTRRRDLYEMFGALYGCFKTVAKARGRELHAPLKSFQTTLKGILLLDEIDFSHKYTEGVSKDQAELPASLNDIRAEDASKWQKVFRTLMRLHPELATRTELNLKTLKTLSTDDLIARYLNLDFSFTWKQLLWELARKHSFDIEVWNAADIEAHRAAIDTLQSSTYEPVRRASVDSLFKQASDPRTLALACVEDGTLAGMCIAVPLDMATDLPFFTGDGAKVDRQDLYSTDLTVDSNHRSNGLGLRLKVEQMIAARLGGFARITSRNRYPEAKAMSRLNLKMGAVVCHVSHTDYGGSGTGLYQSLELRRAHPQLEIFRGKHTLLNKMCLSNFVSAAYVNFLKIWREVLPASLRHVYLSSGESEAVDKWIKTLYAKRPTAHYALSFYGDRFGYGTAASQSLGGKPNEPSPFEWPRLDPQQGAAALRDYLQAHATNEVLGIFVEPAGKAWLPELLELARNHGVPVIFNETQSMLGGFAPGVTWASDLHPPDGFYAFGGNQIALNAVNSEFFISKPLTMISTWDGDEWSLQIFTERLLRFLESREK